MASAPPMEPILSAPPPSYDETMNAGGMYYPPGNAVPPPVHNKGAPALYPVQNYTQMYPPAPTIPAVQGPVVSVQTVYVQPTVFGDLPVQTVCPMCTQTVVSRLDYNSGSMTWLACAGIFIFGCFYGCCLIPFCVDSLKDVRHICPNCNHTMGMFKRL
ncbi:lipopolysaccharide-induced tumor necrosis factor-alpha factor homolog [Trichomycterus rosablanca]|uniref:lipopolysaccharide-induced tumor necrosis factor-alpha factor homolog n=1 Tax=Trichomycterus rosablanca TaxID=2290929 RepID=UPI002F354269